ncbi:hypothetical protein PG984_004075 [Apiospora sp. TS-2023a]
MHPFSIQCDQIPSRSPCLGNMSIHCLVAALEAGVALDLLDVEVLAVLSLPGSLASIAKGDINIGPADEGDDLVLGVDQLATGLLPARANIEGDLVVRATGADGRLGVLLANTSLRSELRWPAQRDAKRPVGALLDLDIALLGRGHEGGAALDLADDGLAERPLAFAGVAEGGVDIGAAGDGDGPAPSVEDAAAQVLALVVLEVVRRELDRGEVGPRADRPLLLVLGQLRLRGELAGAAQDDGHLVVGAVGVGGWGGEGTGCGEEAEEGGGELHGDGFGSRT